MGKGRSSCAGILETVVLVVLYDDLMNGRQILELSRCRNNPRSVNTPWSIGQRGLGQRLSALLAEWAITKDHLTDLS